MKFKNKNSKIYIIECIYVWWKLVFKKQWNDKCKIHSSESVWMETGNLVWEEANIV